MIQKKILNPLRVRAITGSFAYIEHRFLKNGFFKRLNHKQLLLYFFLVMAADKHGLSYYSYDKICSFLGLTLDDYIDAIPHIEAFMKTEKDKELLDVVN